MFRCDFDVMESLEILEELGELNTAFMTLSMSFSPIWLIFIISHEESQGIFFQGPGLKPCKQYMKHEGRRQ